MTFPQTSSVIATTRSQEYWRLFTQVESSGDIWESDVGAKALVIGPQSDIARAAVSYLDPQEPDSVNTIEFSATKAAIGRIDALNPQTFPGGLPARLLITLKDLLPEPGFRPVAAGVGDSVIVNPAFIDVIQYLTPQTSYISSRSTNTYRIFQLLSTVDPTWYCFPYYGRRHCDVLVRNGGVAVMTIELWGFSFSTIGGAGTTFLNQERLMDTSAATAVGGTAEVSMSNTDFDYFAVRLPSGNTNMAFTASVSDAA